MKIFDRDGKWNFVDGNNVFVGYDNGQDCCENAGYHLTRTLGLENDSDLAEESLDGYIFDTTFFREGVIPQETLEDGGSATFRLIKGSEEAFLTIFNSHNGYYGHGFEAKINGIEWKSGCL